MNQKQLAVLKLGLNKCGIKIQIIQSFYRGSTSKPIQSLVQKGFIEEVKNKVQVFKTTKKGERLVLKKIKLDKYQRILM